MLRRFCWHEPAVSQPLQRGRFIAAAFTLHQLDRAAGFTGLKIPPAAG
jgi:hypothetical protein